MRLEQSDSPVWHKLSQLDTMRQFIMCEDTRHVLNNWNIKYINLRIDMRTGQFCISEGNTKAPKFLKISKGEPC